MLPPCSEQGTPYSDLWDPLPSGIHWQRILYGSVFHIRYSGSGGQVDCARWESLEGAMRLRRASRETACSARLICFVLRRCFRVPVGAAQTVQRGYGACQSNSNAVMLDYLGVWGGRIMATLPGVPDGVLRPLWSADHVCGRFGQRDVIYYFALEIGHQNRRNLGLGHRWRLRAWSSHG
jgi:hypothetical protein